MPQLRSSKANPVKEQIEFVSTKSDEGEFILSDAYSLVEVPGSENGDELEISQESSLEDDMDKNLDVNNSNTGNITVILFLIPKLALYSRTQQRSHLNKGCYGMLHNPLKCNFVNFEIPIGFLYYENPFGISKLTRLHFKGVCKIP